MDHTIGNGRFGLESESLGLEAVSEQDIEDVRVRVARRKRERMRERLLSAALSIFLSDRGGDAAIAEDVMKAAGVSRGTFYKYFNSVEEAADAVGQRLADEAVRELIRAFSGQKRTPIERAALGAQMLMSRAVVQPAWGGFVSRSGHLSQDSTYAAAVRRTTLDGRASGDFKFKSTKAAVDFQIGAVMEGVRRIVAGHPHPRAYLREVATMTLKGLGADHDRSEAAVAKASRDLSILGPQLPWWRDFN
jgi:AcrR family transcriptional regulator